MLWHMYNNSLPGPRFPENTARIEHLEIRAVYLHVLARDTLALRSADPTRNLLPALSGRVPPPKAQTWGVYNSTEYSFLHLLPGCMVGDSITAKDSLCK